jgi:hypothetical protein
MPCSSRSSLARGRRVDPSATARKIEPENFGAHGRGCTIHATRRAARSETVGIAATNGAVAAPAPKRIVAVTPANGLDLTVRAQRSARRHGDERRCGSLRRCAGDKNASCENKFGCPHEAPRWRGDLDKNAKGGEYVPRAGQARDDGHWADRTAPTGCADKAHEIVPWFASDTNRRARSACDLSDTFCVEAWRR